MTMFLRIEKIAIDRRELCLASIGGSLLSSLNRLPEEMISIYFLNNFCQHFGVPIHYLVHDFIDGTARQDLKLLTLNGTCDSRIQPLSYRNDKETSEDYISSSETKDIDENLESISVDDQVITIPDEVDSSLLSTHTITHDRLKSIATGVADDEGYVFLVLATSGYASMLMNFLCSAARFRSHSNILVVTHDELIVNLAMRLNATVFSPNELADQARHSHEFGTLLYQDLMLTRTEIALKLLTYGLRPIVADIDTVWLTDPLDIVKNQVDWNEVDIAVTNDDGEVCGCFIVMRNTVNAYYFWSNVTYHHQKLVQRARDAESLRYFSDSEQKIITEMLVKGKYSGHIVVQYLPDELFPSGKTFFQDGLSLESSPSIVHNNFVLGLDIKLNRFMRHGLWFVNGTDDLLNQMCTTADHPLMKWKEIFHEVSRNFNLSSINVVYPVHNSMISPGRFIVQVSAEHWLPTERPSVTMWLASNPSVYLEGVGVYELIMRGNLTTSSLRTMVGDSSFVVAADYSIGKSTFSIDRADAFHEIAHEYVVSLMMKTPKIYTLEHKNHVIFDRNAQPSSSSANFSSKIFMTYSIKVLAFNRPRSLNRLLTSLSRADYQSNNVSLEIFIDGERSTSDTLLIEEVILVADSFEWPFGVKTITRRNRNFGLVQQWYHAWDPKTEREAAFVFEDDTEVSPYFFKWSLSAVDLYYASDSNQRKIHWQLLAAVRTLAKWDGGNGSELSASQKYARMLMQVRDFVRIHAGRPMLYGVCLQKQGLDPNHYPRKLNIRNGNRPFLYSLIGSWGPLLLPVPWLAFKSWWSLTSLANASYIPFTEDLLTNEFLKSNPNIWTPWIIRFAYDTGFRCLYPNLPGNISFVGNHREKGENYATAFGIDSELLTAAHFNQPNRIRRALLSAINYLPSIDELAKWQYDFNLRRAGSFGSERLYLDVYNPSPDQNETRNFLNEMTMALGVSSTDHAHAASCQVDKLSIPHYLQVIESIVQILLPKSGIIYLDASPLMIMLSRHEFHHLVYLFAGASCNDLPVIAEKLKDYHCVDEATHTDIAKEYSMMIVTFHQLHDLLVSGVLISIPRVEYLVVIGPCASAPSELSVQVSNDRFHLSAIHDNNSTHSFEKFVAIEDYCVQAHDEGVVIYR